MKNELDKNKNEESASQNIIISNELSNLEKEKEELNNIIKEKEEENKSLKNQIEEKDM